MCRIKNLAILLGLCMVITACGSSEQQKSKVMLYQGDKNKKEEGEKRHLRRENFGDSQPGLSE